MKRVGRKLYIVLSQGSTEAFVNRQQARDWSRNQNGVILEHRISPWTQGKVENILEGVEQGF